MNFNRIFGKNMTNDDTIKDTVKNVLLNADISRSFYFIKY